MMAAAQQLSPFDRRRLDEHLAGCATCRDFYRDMALLGGALATADTDNAKNTRPFSGPAIVPDSVPPNYRVGAFTVSGSHYRTWWGAAAAAIVCFAGGLALAKYTARAHAPDSNIATQRASPKENIPVKATPQAERPAQLGTATASMSASNEAVLEAELSRLRIEFQRSQDELNSLRQQHAEAAQGSQNVAADLTKLRLENASQQEFIRQIEAQLDQAHSGHAQDVKLIALRDEQIRELTANVVASVNESADARKRGEATRLMEQRNLHVVDVYDNNTKGQRSAAFGRVFYSEGGPLMFVAFDLPNSGRSGKTTYHAWGETDGSSKNPLQLGTFALDDTVSQRWVLRVTDAQLLKQVDAVFITADHGNDVRSPGGTPLLYAYLHQVPNHP